MGISEVEFLGSGPEDDESESDSGPASAPGSEPGSAAESGSESESEFGFEARDTVATPPDAPRWRLPRRSVFALLAALLVGVAAGTSAVLVKQDKAADAFNVTLVSASYLLPQDASGIDLTLAVQNTGSTMVELDGLAFYQPGLIRLTQTGDAPGVTESEAGASTTTALGTGTAITPVAMAPKDVQEITVPFRYDCNMSATPPVSRSLSLAGFSAHGTARTTQLALPASVTPWQEGNILRTAVCGQPTPQADLGVVYGGIGDTQMQLTPVRFNYSIALTAPTATSITVSSVSQDNPGISATVDPQLPVQILDGQTVRLTVTWRVMSCVIATSVHSGDGIQITASAFQSVQTWHTSLGAQFTKDLDAEISTVCSGG